MVIVRGVGNRMRQKGRNWRARLLRGAAVCLAVLLTAGFTSCGKPVLEPGTNVDGYEFPARTLFVGEKGFLLTIRLTAHRAGAAELGYAVYGDCELVVQSSSREEITALNLNQYFGGKPLGFAKAAFPEESGTERYFQDYDDKSAILFAVGQDLSGRDGGERCFVPFELDSSGGLSVLPVEGGYLLAGEKKDFLDFSDSYGDKLLLLPSPENSEAEHVEYAWNGEEYSRRESAEELLPREEAFDSALQLRPYSATAETAAPKGESLTRQVVYAETGSADCFYFEGRLRVGNSVPYQQSLYRARGGHTRLIVRQEGLGARLSSAVFDATDGGTLWWSYEDGRAWSYGMKTGEVREQEWAPVRIMQKYALLPSPNQPEYVFQELATGRVVRISRAGTGQVFNRLTELTEGRLPLVRQQGKKFTLSLTDLATGESGPAYDISFIGMGGEMEVAVCGEFAVITSIFYQESAMYLYNLQTGEHRKLLSSRAIMPKDVHFIDRDRLLYLDRYLGGSVCLYEIGAGRMTHPEGFEAGQWGGIQSSPDGSALLVTSQDGSEVVAVTPEETREK